MKIQDGLGTDHNLKQQVVSILCDCGPKISPRLNRISLYNLMLEIVYIVSCMYNYVYIIDKLYKYIFCILFWFCFGESAAFRCGMVWPRVARRLAALAVVTVGIREKFRKK
jgi:hypothetical protein